MQGDDSSNDESLSVPSNTTTPPESRDNGAFAAELRDLELRLEQLELEQRSLRIQLQRARLRHAEPTATSPTPSSTPPQQREPSVRPSPTPGRPVSSGAPSGRRNNPYLRPLATTSGRDPTTPSLEPYTSRPLPPHRTEVPDFRTPQAGDRLDATGQVLRIGDEVSFHTTSYTTGGVGTVKRFTATFVIIHRNNSGDIRRAPSNVTRLHAPTY